MDKYEEELKNIIDAMADNRLVQKEKWAFEIALEKYQAYKKDNTTIRQHENATFEPKPNSCAIILETTALIGNEQETIEEAALNIIPDKSTSGWIDSFGATERIGFIKGAKWQQERMYSESEAKTIWRAGQEYWKTSGKSITFEELIEQFKKK
jgi:hypothetical protein